jgi:hypothetical protein
MKRLLLALVLALSAAGCAWAASPLDDYFAARDAYLKKFKEGDISSDEMTRAHERALDDLGARLRNVIGPTGLFSGADEAGAGADRRAAPEVGQGIASACWRTPRNDGCGYAARTVDRN